MSPDLPSLSQPLLASRRLRWLAWAARSALTLVVAAWLLLGLGWALIHGWIVPRIADLRPQLEQLASGALGLPVRIGHISASAEGGSWVPSFELTDVSLLDASGRPALQLARVRAALSPSSLLKRSFEQLILEQPELDLRRTADGQLLVAGLAVSLQHQDQGHALGSWLFAQPELVIRGGTLHWVDELKQTPPVTLTEVDAVLRNPGRRHQMRLDATPPPAWGDRFSVRGLFRQPLLTLDAGQWEQWSGELYAQFQRADLAQLAPYAPLQELGIKLAAGQGSLRAWVDVDKGALAGATADLALDHVAAQLGPDLAPLQFSSMAGRLGARALAQGSEWRTEGLSFETADGLRWPGGNLLWQHSHASAAAPERHEIKADKLDLQAAAQIADRLPLPAATREHIRQLAPRGLVDSFQAQWQGPLEAPQAFSARGKVSGLALAAGNAPAGPGRFQPGRPGVSGAQLDFSVSPTGGQGKLMLNQGWLELPGVFEEPRIPFAQLSADISVKRDGELWAVDLRQAQVANADVQGRFQAHWQTGPLGALPAQASQADTRFPGVLDLQGQFSRGDASRVHRYLPLSLPESARQYVRAAISQGQLKDVNFKVKGDLAQLFKPDAQAKKPKDDFLITAKLKGGSYAFVPKYLEPAGSKPWPTLAQLDADLLFDHNSLQVSGVRARLPNGPALVLGKASARVADLTQPVVEVSAELKGPLAQALQVINGSPIGGLINGVLAPTVGNGVADYAFKLNVPVNNVVRSAVQGSVSLPGNDVQFTPDSPALSRLRGVLQFSEASFNVTSAQARMLGGDLRFEGGSRPAQRAGSGEPEVSFRGQGTVTAEGLLAARELGALTGLARQVNGSASYTASLGFRQGQAELSVSSNLQGMGLQMPAPLNKPATAAWPLRFDKTVLRDALAPGKKAQDQLLLTVGPGPGLARPLQALYVRDISGAQPQVLRGSLALGRDSGDNPLPAQGVRVNLNLDQLDVDAWEPFTQALSAGASPGPGLAGASSYLPTAYALRAREFKLQGYTLHQVALNGQREGLNWRAQVSANEVDGQLEFRQAAGNSASSAPGRLFARLSRLSLGASTARELETNLLQTQPTTVPALDIVVEDLELRGKKLGRLEVEAINRTAPTMAREGTREWRLNKLNLRLPEASFTASGQWSAQTGNPATTAERRGTNMNFKLEIADSGELLKRLGMDGLIRRGRGRMEGQLGWDGSPLSLHYPSLHGQFNVAMEEGQFLKADPGVAKLLGVLSLQALPRRLTLDFRDVFSQGFTFDVVRGDVGIEQGVASTNNLQMKGVNAAVLMQGKADIIQETQDLQVVVVPELNAGTASLIASTINPVVGLGTFLAQMLLRRPLAEAATQEFHITSTWSDPRITRVERNPARAPAKASSDKP